MHAGRGEDAAVREHRCLGDGLSTYRSTVNLAMEIDKQVIHHAPFVGGAAAWGAGSGARQHIGALSS